MSEAEFCNKIRWFAEVPSCLQYICVVNLLLMNYGLLLGFRWSSGNGICLNSNLFLVPVTDGRMISEVSGAAKRLWWRNRCACWRTVLLIVGGPPND